MSVYSYASQFVQIKLMLAGLKANQAVLSKRGITPEFITEFETVYQEIQLVDSEKEALKARLKEKTQEFLTLFQKMKKFHREAKKLVKVELSSASWKEFGIQDKR